MTSDSILLIVVGLLFGGWFGHAHAWRMARKLEHHGVRLDKWDEHFDAQAPAVASVTNLRRAQ